MKIGVDRYGRKVQLTDDKGLVPARERVSIKDLFEKDQRKAQETDVVKDDRETVVTDANDDINKFLKDQGKDKPEAQNPDVIFEFSTTAGDDIAKMDSEQKKEENTDKEQDKPVPSEDDRGEYVAEAPADDKTAFEREQAKTQKAAASKKVKAEANIDAEGGEKIESQKATPKEPEKATGGPVTSQGSNPNTSMSQNDVMVRLDSKKAQAALEAKVKSRWAKTIASILFDPFQLDGKKAVAFKIGKDAVLMPSVKPTKTEWLTAKSIINELRDPSILRTAQLVESVDVMEDTAVPEPVEGEAEMGTPDEIENIQTEEKDILQNALDALESGDTDKAKSLIQDVLDLEKKEDEQEEAEENGEEGEVEEEEVGEMSEGEVPPELEKE